MNKKEAKHKAIDGAKVRHEEWQNPKDYIEFNGFTFTDQDGDQYDPCYDVQEQGWEIYEEPVKEEEAPEYVAGYEAGLKDHNLELEASIKDEIVKKMMDYLREEEA